MHTRFVALLSFLFLTVAGVAGAGAQTFSVEAGGGPNIIDAGYNMSVSAGYWPASRLALLVAVERTHAASRITFGTAPDGRPVVSSAFRGGTVTAATGTLRASLFPADRVTPYVLVGAGRGVSHPNVNEHFPTAVTNKAVFVMAGAGVSVPVRDHLNLFADARMLFGAEGVEGIIALVPLRAGAIWRF